MNDGYDYFSDFDQSIEMSMGESLKKTLTYNNYFVPDATLQFAPRDRLITRQTYNQNQVVQGQNRSIILNDGKTDRLIIGYAKGGF